MNFEKSENPGLILVPTQLTGNNFLSWRTSMIRALIVKEKLHFVDGSEEIPDEGTREFKRWKRNDCLVTAWILNTVSKDVAEGFNYATSAAQLWKELALRLGDSNGPLLYKLKRDLSLCSQGNLSLMQYFNKMKSFWDEIAQLRPLPICNCGAVKNCACNAFQRIADLREEDRLIQFLMGLNSHYDHIKNQILISDPLPDINKSYSMLLRVEKQSEISQEQSIDIACYSNNSSSSFNRSETQAQYKNRKKENEDKFCDHCRASGHLKSGCFKLIGYPDWWKDPRKKNMNGNRSNKQQFSANVKQDVVDSQESYGEDNVDMALMIKEVYQMLKSNRGKQPETSTPLHSPGDFSAFAGFSGNLFCYMPDDACWIIDSGATSHMCCHKEWITRCKSVFRKQTITMPDGTCQEVSHTGTVKLTSSIFLLDVLYVPAFQYNLLSVGQLLQQTQIQIIFHDTHCCLQDLETLNTLAVAWKRDGLYILDKESFSNATITKVTNSGAPSLNISCSAAVSTNLWHRRLGHASYEVLSHIGVIGSISTSHTCTICHAAKQHRLPFPLSSIKSTHRCELLHMDVWGPYSVDAISGGKYFLTIVDDFSRVTWIVLLKYKSQVPEAIEVFLRMVHTQYAVTVKVIRSDNGGEFFNHQCKHLFQNYGIIHQHSCAYTPQQKWSCRTQTQAPT
ncbi:hypothetical protein M5689_023829 [Euphorbia peplus]|nr:hypothetical protein M5689_023829 [Euphorbia peplus]